MPFRRCYDSSLSRDFHQTHLVETSSELRLRTQAERRVCRIAAAAQTVVIEVSR